MAAGLVAAARYAAALGTPTRWVVAAKIYRASGLTPFAGHQLQLTVSAGVSVTIWKINPRRKGWSS